MSETSVGEILRALGRIEARMDDALRQALVQDKTLANHNERLTALEKTHARQGGYVAAIALAVTVVITAVQFLKDRLWP